MERLELVHGIYDLIRTGIEQKVKRLGEKSPKANSFKSCLEVLQKKLQGYEDFKEDDLDVAAAAKKFGEFVAGSKSAKVKDLTDKFKALFVLLGNIKAKVLDKEKTPTVADIHCAIFGKHSENKGIFNVFFYNMFTERHVDLHTQILFLVDKFASLQDIPEKKQEDSDSDMEFSFENKDDNTDTDEISTVSTPSKVTPASKPAFFSAAQEQSASTEEKTSIPLAESFFFAAQEQSAPSEKEKESSALLGASAKISHAKMEPEWKKPLHEKRQTPAKWREKTLLNISHVRENLMSLGEEVVSKYSLLLSCLNRLEEEVLDCRRDPDQISLLKFSSLGAKDKEKFEDVPDETPLLDIIYKQLAILQGAKEQSPFNPNNIFCAFDDAKAFCMAVQDCMAEANKRWQKFKDAKEPKQYAKEQKINAKEQEMKAAEYEIRYQKRLIYEEIDDALHNSDSCKAALQSKIREILLKETGLTDKNKRPLRAFEVLLKHRNFSIMQIWRFGASSKGFLKSLLETVGLSIESLKEAVRADEEDKKIFPTTFCFLPVNKAMLPVETDEDSRRLLHPTPWHTVLSK